MPKMNPGFLQRLKDKALSQIDKRIREEFSKAPTPGIPTPGIPADIAPPEQELDAPEPEVVEPSFAQRIKQRIVERVQRLAPVQRRLLDPNRALDEATIKYRIRYAGESRLLLHMLVNGQWRHVEPYSYRMNGRGAQGQKELRFYGYCRLHDQIHSFNLKKIHGLVVTNLPFNPRWPIEVA